jgi:serine/threonine protein phosphatase PrpC
MGSFLDKPKTEKTTDCGQGNDLKYGVSAMQGWRIEMEDSHCSKIGLSVPGLEKWAFFAVFDGHAGGTVSKYIAQELITCILEADKPLFAQLGSLCLQANAIDTSSPTSSPSKNRNSQTTASDTNASVNHNNLSNINNITNSPKKGDTTNSKSFNSSSEGDLINSNIEKSENQSNDDTISNSTNLNNKEDTSASQETTSTNKKPTTNNSSPTSPIQSNYPELENSLKAAIKKGFLDLDEKIRQMNEFQKGEDKSGSTAVACLISPTHVYLINCGDSRAIFVSNNQVVLNTTDHKPINPNERERIQNAGGSVMIQRVNGSLAVSRALGDFEYKSVEGRGPCEQLVSPEPEIYVRERCNDKDEFVVLACDGIWDVMTNEDLKEFIHSRLKVTHDLVKISNEVLDMCLNKVRILI